MYSTVELRFAKLLDKIASQLEKQYTSNTHKFYLTDVLTSFLSCTTLNIIIGLILLILLLNVLVFYTCNTNFLKRLVANIKTHAATFKN